ncbi:MAG: aldehyde ferredoxin oxidoreductase family protein [Anaerolineaceae bacterium]|nr:aldehyde ferredoxin oxidoreductase family protein [Anaerolineaceae bacterium]MDD4042173.1 aldehyde ferredoxin oxidoreductase family protein [Anaerolineaceae bacterium]MDD4577009.1 aldehyde ferredoxin oxidoreductase family protein [Anaerolineaceae bacterium]
MYGYSGKILHIDLKTKKSWVETKPEEWYKIYIGGVSMASRLLWENIVPGCDPLDDGNPICFANGIFTGTPVPVGGKFGMASKSPLTGVIGDSLSGSWFSIALKRAGWDGVVLHNSCDKWTQLFIDDDRVQFNDATYLLGKGTFETEEAIREKLGDDQIRSCTIGPCGENLVRYANVTNDGRQLGRTGHGMLWGHKKLKAVSVRGTKGVTVFDPATLNQLSFDISKSAQGKDTEKYRVYGTATGLLAQNKSGVLPTRNFQEGVYEDAEMVSGEYLDKHHKVKVIACAQCPIACEQMSIVKTGEFAGAMTGIEYESLFANSSNLGINDMRCAIKLITIADQDGMDTVSMGVTIGYAMECFEKGVLTEKDFVCASHPEGFTLNFGDGDSAVKLAEMIRDREGIGNLMAEGVRIASKKIDEERGTDSWKWALHIKGLEPAGYDARSTKTFAVGLATGTRGGCHNRSAAYDPDLKGEVDRLTVDPTRGHVAAESEEYAAVYDTLPLCKFIRRSFTGKADRAGAWPAIAKLINATTGWDFDYDDVDLIGIRATNIKKAFNIREGWTQEDDELPWRWKHEPMTKGPGAGVVTTDEELEYLKQLYYKAKNWTEEGLIPKEYLIKLGMADVAEEIGV